MNKSAPSSVHSFCGDDNDVSSLDDYEDTFLDIAAGVTESKSNPARITLNPLNSSTPCLFGSLPTSSVETGYEWEEPWLVSMANSDSCLLSTTGSSSGASPLTGTSSQGMSPTDSNIRAFPFDPHEDPDQSLSSISEALQTEKDFMDYVMSFPASIQCIQLAASAELKKGSSDSSPKVGLDHLDNLCKLMEQLSDLKEANIKLKRRVQYLEDIKTLHEIHKEMVGESTLCNSGLSEDETQSRKLKPGASPNRQLSDEKEPVILAIGNDSSECFTGLYRSKTTTHIDRQDQKPEHGHKSRNACDLAGCKRERSKSVGHPGHSKCKKRSSRWSKVKEVLGIERLDVTSDTQQDSQDGEGSRISEANSSDTDALRNKSELPRSVAGRKESETTKPHKDALRSRSNGLSSSFSKIQQSSTETKQDKKADTLDGPKTAQKVGSRMEKDDIGAKKSLKTPWGRMKTIIQIRRDSRHPKSESSSSSSRGAKKIINELTDNNYHGSRRNPRTTNRSFCTPLQDDTRKCQYGPQIADVNQNNISGNGNGSRNMIGQSQLERQKKYSQEQPRKFEKGQEEFLLQQKYSGRPHQKREVQKGSLGKQQIKGSNENLSRKALVPEEQKTDSNKTSPRTSRDHQQTEFQHILSRRVSPSKETGKRKKNKPRPLTLHSGGPDPPGVVLSAEEDERPRSPGSSPLTHKKWVWSRVKDVLKGKREEGGRMSLSVPASPTDKGGMFNFETIPIEGTEATKVETTPNDGKPSSTVDHTGAKLPQVLCPTGPSATVAELLKELQLNLSEDFNKKLEEWQRFRGEGPKQSLNPEVERKDSFSRFRKISKPEKKSPSAEKSPKHNSCILKKDLSWLDKELQKMEREILRLSKDKQKFEQRAYRLRRLRDATTDAHRKQEVLVKTSAGEFRFEGISDAFTKKLYEWERKKGVGPEFSTIALLDESLKPPDPTDLRLQRDCRSAAEFGGPASRSSPEPSSKTCYQISKASSEPDLSVLTAAQKEGVTASQAMRSKSGDTLLTQGDDGDPPKEEDGQEGVGVHQEGWMSRPRSRDLHPSSEDNYYCLLEENMFLLDQLKGKEEICSRLQNELDRLDERTEKAGKTHQEEMEKYRQKLWEIHVSRPRDLQGSLHLISELKTRIEELQTCSDKLKSDREKLEENFRYHSEQQSRLAGDLIHRMTDLQETCLPIAFNRTGCRRKWKKLMKCDATSVARIHELSTQLLQQAQDMEQTLAERTRQVCHLRWELLQRDISAVLLQAALHRVTSQGPQTTLLPNWDMKRIKFKELKAWSIDTTTRRQSEDNTAEDWLQDRLRQLSLAPYNDWTSIEFNPNELMTTIHELKKEAIRMFPCRSGRISDSDEHKKTASCSADSEIADSDRNYDTGSAFNSRSSSFSSGPLRGSHSDTRLYERRRSLSGRRTSSSSMSCVSGVDASDSSSMHDSGDRTQQFLLARRTMPWRGRWHSRDNVSSSCSSRSSVLEDDLNIGHWDQAVEADQDEGHDDSLCRQLQLRYGSFKEADEEDEEQRGAERDQDDKYSSDDWGSQCLITPRPMHVGLAIGDSRGSADSSYAFLKELMSHTYKNPTKARESSPEYENLVDSDDLLAAGYSGPAVSYDEEYDAQESFEKTSQRSYHITKLNKDGEPVINDATNVDVSYLTMGQEDQEFRSGAENHNSSAYTSVESLENEEIDMVEQKYRSISNREGPAFHNSDTEEGYVRTKLDKASNGTRFVNSGTLNGTPFSEINVAADSQSVAWGKSLTQESDINTQSSVLSKFKYKGTKGFGRSPKMDFRQHDDQIDSSIKTVALPASGVVVASDRSPEQRQDENYR